MSNKCPASVIQTKRGSFTKGVASHNHPAKSETAMSFSTPSYSTPDQSNQESVVRNLPSTPISETCAQKPVTSTTSPLNDISNREPETEIPQAKTTEREPAAPTTPLTTSEDTEPETIITQTKTTEREPAAPTTPPPTIEETDAGPETITTEREPATPTSPPTTTEDTDAEPETIIDVTELSENMVYYEIEACLPRLKKQSSVLLSSDGFIFKQKVNNTVLIIICVNVYDFMTGKV